MRSVGVLLLLYHAGKTTQKDFLYGVFSSTLQTFSEEKKHRNNATTNLAIIQ